MGKIIGTIIVIWSIIGAICWLWTRHTILSELLAIWVVISAIICIVTVIKNR